MRGNGFFSFLLFLLASYGLWLSLTLNRVYEANIPVLVHVNNVPIGAQLECGDGIPSQVCVKGDGKLLFSYMFKDEVDVSVEYFEFTRNGDILTMPTSALRGRVASRLSPKLSLLRFSSDSLYVRIANPVKKVQAPTLKPYQVNHSAEK